MSARALPAAAPEVTALYPPGQALWLLTSLPSRPPVLVKVGFDTGGATVTVRLQGFDWHGAQVASDGGPLAPEHRDAPRGDLFDDFATAHDAQRIRLLPRQTPLSVVDVTGENDDS